MKKIKSTMFRVCRALNLPKIICSHMLGPNHSHSHKIFVGTLVMLVGVFIAKIHVELEFIAYLIDGAGYLLHGIGAVPVVEFITKAEESAEV